MQRGIWVESIEVDCEDEDTWRTVEVLAERLGEEYMNRCASTHPLGEAVLGTWLGCEGPKGSA